MKATRDSYGEALLELGKENSNIVVLDADLATATKTVEFKKAFSERFFDMGIAEQDMIGTAAGLAIGGKIPFASTFAIFASGRAYDQIRNGVCYSKLNVKIAATHAGITVGEDGASHQALEDIALMRVIPNLTVFSPCDDIETKWIVREASKLNGPVYIRLTRPKVEEIYAPSVNFEFGKAVQHGEGNDATIIATGVTVAESLKAQKELKEKGINVRVLDVHTIKPLDEETILKAAKESEIIFTVEDHSIIGGLGGAVCELLSEKFPKKVIRIGIKDEFGQSGKWDELMRYYGIDSENIVRTVEKYCKM